MDVGTLLPVREELLVHPAPRQHDGAPAWTLEDPGRAQFFQIGWAEAEILARWSLGRAALVAQAVSNETTLAVTAEDVLHFQRFLQSSNLLQERGPGLIARHVRELQASRRKGWLSYLLHHYLYFRIPLLRPDALLTRTLPWVRVLFFTRGFARCTVAAGLVGLFLVARQWDAFLHTFLHFFTLEGALLAGLTLAFTKILHELGHAYAAKYHDCRVATMGVAFVVMWPVLYTDTTGAWRLPRRRDRLAIGAAGMITETSLAAWATLAWSFLPDGMPRSAAFMLATTTWLMTLAVNLNPLMRFDGYFLLSDALNVPNLQQRAFALGRWKLREWLFGLCDPVPEHYAAWRHTALLAYAFSVWIYRFFLFLGIALLVYHKAFKLLGILLFAVEIGVFLLRPMVNEIRAWHQRLRQPGPARGRRTGIVTFSLSITALLLAAIPWHTRINAPALLQSADAFVVQAPVAARLARIEAPAGAVVRAGTPLFILDSPELEHDYAAITARVKLLEWQLAFHTMRKDTGADVPIARDELRAARERQTVLARQRDNLRIAAPFDGVVADLAAPLRNGDWIAAGEWLGTVARPDNATVIAYVTEEDVYRLREGATARFIPEAPGVASVPLVLSGISATASRRLGAAPELASSQGGGVPAVRPPPDAGSGSNTDRDAHAWVPEQAVYLVRLEPAENAQKHDLGQRVLRGTVLLQGESQSLIGRTWTRALALLLRETGF